VRVALHAPLLRLLRPLRRANPQRVEAVRERRARDAQVARGLGHDASRVRERFSQEGLLAFVDARAFGLELLPQDARRVPGRRFGRREGAAGAGGVVSNGLAANAGDAARKVTQHKVRRRFFIGNG
jgi:hypothetical protein